MAASLLFWYDTGMQLHVEDPHDLTRGSIVKKMVLFFLPLLLGSILQQLYTTVDAIIIGNFSGKMGLAAIDSVASLLRLPVNFFMGISTGATILIGQYFGAALKEKVQVTIHTSITFGILGGLLLSVIGILVAPYCVELLEVPQELQVYSTSYMRVMFGGLFVSLIYNIASGISRALGNSKTPFYALAVATVLNILLDLLFIVVFDMGVAGAALATVLSQAVSAILMVLSLTKLPYDMRFFFSHLGIKKDSLMRMIRLGLPVGFQASLYPIANMLIQSNINQLGTDTIAAWALTGKLDLLIWVGAESFYSAISTFVAQNYGAGHLGRIRKGVRFGLLLNMGFVILISAVLFFFSGTLAKIFISPEDYDILPQMVYMMRFLAPLYFLVVIGDSFGAAIRGSGETLIPMILSLLATCVLRVLWVLFVVPSSHNMRTIMLSYPISWAASVLLYSIYYYHYQKKHFPL